MSTFTPEKASADIGVYGLGVMGANLARNLARNGYATAVFNRTPARTEKLMAEHGDEATFVPASTLEDFVASLRAPRVAIMMVQAGPSTDAVMEQLADLMDEGDIIVDCGNSLFTDTIRREKWAAERGLHFVGAGVSGGEEGALWGPSIMPGGTPASYDRLGPMFEAIAGTYDGVPCCTYIGANGAGHFVKMVHNGIEYADMQVIAEAYTLLREGLGATPAEIADIFDKFKIFDRIKDLDDNDLLFLVVERFCNPKIDLSPASISNSDMGDIYEELIQKFSEASNETAGEHFSPRDGLRLAAELLVVGEMDDLTQPNRIVKVCDPCAGTGGALTVFADRVAEINPQATVVTYAQEINGQSYAICKSDTILKGGNIANVHLGDTLADDRMPGDTFGYQISNPPYGVDWKKSQAAVKKEHEELGFAGRFGAGLPRISDGQLLFVQHMVAKMRPVDEGGGRIAVFLNGSPLFTGAAGSGESEVRRYLLEHDLVDAIVAMPNDFFSTTPRSRAARVRCSSSTPTGSTARCARALATSATSSATRKSSRSWGSTRPSRMPTPSSARCSTTTTLATSPLTCAAHSEMRTATR